LNQEAAASAKGEQPKTADGGPLVSIILLAHNKVAYTERCLQGLEATPYRPFEVVAVNNGSTDATGALLDQHAEQLGKLGVAVRRVDFERNVGAVIGRNRAVTKARGEFLVLLDNDVAPRTLSWMGRMVDFLRTNQDIGAVGPKLVYPFLPHLIQCAGCEVSPTGKVSFLGRGEPREAPEFNRERECQALISACWMMPASAARVAGPLDEGYSPVQFEDIDYCYRLREAGYKVVYLPSVEMYHFENVTTGRTEDLNYKYLTVKNGLRFKNKWQRRFSREGGRADEDMPWRHDLPTCKLEDIGELETVA
jgi:GT2 family glycosyltransferase